MLTWLSSKATELRRGFWELKLRSYLNASVCCGVIDPLLSIVRLFPGLFWLLGTYWKGAVTWSTFPQTEHHLTLSVSPLHVPTDTRRCTYSCTQLHASPLTQFTQLLPALRRNTAQPWLSFTHRTCYRVIALLINVSPSQDNGLVFKVRFSRLAMRDIQCRNLLSVYYALHGSPLGTLLSGSNQDAH